MAYSAGSTPQHHLPRRAVLRGLVAGLGAGIIGTAPLAGCDLINTGDEGVPPHQLSPFLAATVALGAEYDATLAAIPTLSTQLTPVRDAHRAHAAALANALGLPVPPGPSTPPNAPSDSAAALTALAQREKSGRDEAVVACLSAPARVAALVASIAAARASHLEVLR